MLSEQHLQVKMRKWQLGRSRPSCAGKDNASLFPASAHGVGAVVCTKTRHATSPSAYNAFPERSLGHSPLMSRNSRFSSSFNAMRNCAIFHVCPPVMEQWHQQNVSECGLLPFCYSLPHNKIIMVALDKRNSSTKVLATTKPQHTFCHIAQLQRLQSCAARRLPEGRDQRAPQTRVVRYIQRLQR